MFDGLAIKAGETATLEGENGEVFHLSQACLSDPRDAGKTYLKIKEGERSLVVCCLQKDKCEHAALDIFVHPATNSFSVEGKNDVHLVGYWEPHGASDSDEDDLDFMADEAEESEAGESDLDDEVPNLLNNERMKKPQGMAALAKAGLDESDEEEDEEQGESDEESMTLPVVAPSKGGKAQAGGVSGNKQKPTQGKPSPAMKAETTPAGKAQPHPAGKAKAAPKPAPKTAAGEAGQKRKQAPVDKAATQPPAKQAKTAPAAKGSAEAGGEEKFQADLSEYLTKHGRTTMSELGSKVKKPAGVSKKLAQFLKDRTNLYKVDGSHVELMK